MTRKICLLLASTFLIATVPMAHAQNPAEPMRAPTTASVPLPVPTVAETRIGSTAFCLYELPSDDEGKRRWLNLGIVQYVEFSHNELKIYYGGGNLGSGHEAKLPIANPAQLQETLDRLRQAAASCR